MLHYKAGYQYVPTAVHAQLIDFPAAITFAPDVGGARQALAIALIDVAEAAMEYGQPLPVPDPKVSDPEMDIEEPNLPAPNGKHGSRRGAVRGNRVKRQDPIRHLLEGRGHSVWVNPMNGRQSVVPRHREINNYTARAICRQLSVPKP